MTKTIECNFIGTNCSWSAESTRNDEEELMSMIKKHILTEHKEIELNSENISKNGSDYPVIFSDKGREILDNISLILDRIQQLSFLVTYYKSNSNAIPKNMMIRVNDDHEKCHNMYLKIIKKLMNIGKKNKFYGHAIELYLFKHQFVVNHINSSI